MKKHIQLYPSESVLEDFYAALVSKNNKALLKIHIPKSDVFYVRAAIEADTGVKYTLDHVERAMYLEGMIDKRDVLEPDRKRDYADGPS
tara:strand:+ start:658 stop:924 length:267 start_codon:yes stop_codon:yes gene_type:complete